MTQSSAQGTRWNKYKGLSFCCCYMLLCVIYCSCCCCRRRRSCCCCSCCSCCCYLETAVFFGCTFFNLATQKLRFSLRISTRFAFRFTWCQSHSAIQPPIGKNCTDHPPSPLSQGFIAFFSARKPHCFGRKVFGLSDKITSTLRREAFAADAEIG